jgi:uncharacterized protein YutE (UPF0331/DUF86 family)
MRDRIIHGYDNVDLQIVWDVAKRDIPQIEPQIQQILTDYEEQERQGDRGIGRPPAGETLSLFST